MIYYLNPNNINNIIKTNLNIIFWFFIYYIFIYFNIKKFKIKKQFYNFKF